MRVGLVRSVALGMVALVGFAGCDDNPTDFDTSDTTSITTNPSAMTVNAGTTALLDSRTINAGDEPTWEEISATVDGSCGHSDITVATAATYEPSIQPPGQFDVTAGNTLGSSCVALSGGGASDTVDVTVVADSVALSGAPDTLSLTDTAQLTAVLLSADGSLVTPFDQTSDLVWTSDDPAVISVDQSGVITSEGPGQAVITATWSGGGVTRSVDSPPIETGEEFPTLAIIDGPPNDTLDINTSVDLSATFTDPAGGFDFPPFDPETDVEWSTSDSTELTVDPVTGVVEAIGTTGATITATWTGNVNVTASLDIGVFVTPPTLTSTDVATASPLDTVTITGTGFLPGIHQVFVDSMTLDPFYAVSDSVWDGTTAFFIMPEGAAGTANITVGVEGILSNDLSVGRTCALDDCPSETADANDAAATAPVVTFPVDVSGIVDALDPNDYYNFTLAAETTIQIDLTWNDGETDASGDLDLLVVDSPGDTAAQCGFVTATGNVPESGECTLPAGDYAFQVNSFDEHVGVYNLMVVVP